MPHAALPGNSRFPALPPKQALRQTADRAARRLEALGVVEDGVDAGALLPGGQRHARRLNGCAVPGHLDPPASASGPGCQTPAPTAQQQNTGLDDKQINLGVVQPGERPAIFGDALRRLTNQAKFMHADLGRYWYSMSASLNRIAADKAAQIEAALVDVTIDAELGKYVNGLADRGHFDAVQVAPASSAEVPDEAGGVRAVVLGVKYPHNGRDGSDALVEAKDILTQRGSTPRVYRNMLVFIAADSRQLDNLKDAVRASLAWGEIVRDTERLNLTQSDSALAKSKLTEANETMKTRLKEAWCYLHYPVQESAQADWEWVSGKIPAQDGLLARALVALQRQARNARPTDTTKDAPKLRFVAKGLASHRARLGLSAGLAENDLRTAPELRAARPHPDAACRRLPDRDC